MAYRAQRARGDGGIDVTRSRHTGEETPWPRRTTALGKRAPRSGSASSATAWRRTCPTSTRKRPQSGLTPSTRARRGGGQQRARYLMLRLLERAREQPRRRPGADQHRLRQHHPHRARAVVPRRRGGRAPLPGLDPLERGDDGAPRAAPGRRRRRPHLDLRVLGERCTRSASTTSSAARTTPAAATRSTSRATPPPACTPARSSRAGCRPTSSTASARSSRTPARAAACRPTRTRG